MGVVQLVKAVVGIRAPRKVAPKPKRKRATRAQMESRELAKIEQEAKRLEAEARLRQLKRRLEYLEDDDEPAWKTVLKEIGPDLARAGLAVAGALRPAAAPSAEAAPTAESPKQLTSGPAAEEDEMDEYSKQILPFIQNKTPEQAASWLREFGARDKLIGTVLNRLVSMPESEIPNQLAQVAMVAPSLVEYCRKNQKWFIATVRALRPAAAAPASAGPIDPTTVAL